MAAAMALVTSGLLVATTGAAPAAPSASPGQDWSVTPVAGGLKVTLELDEPLPVVDDAPTLVVDGVDYGIATESEDGLSLSVITSDASVGTADDVTFAWSTGGEKVTPSNSAVTEKAPAAITSAGKARSAARGTYPADDGSQPGTYDYVEDDYDFGDQAIAMAGIGGIKGEMTGRIYLPTTGGPRPTVVLLHGRHTSCGTVVSGTQNPGRWPCVPGQVEIPSYKGYDVTGQTLATQGYAVISIGADAINANDAQLTLDNGALARGQLVIDALKMLRKANAGQAVSYHDDALNQDLTLDQALASTTADTSGTIPTGALTASDLVGRFDLDNVGLMGHSRGGEGVVSAVTLNQGLTDQFGIRSVLPLAPVDFARMTVADTDMLVMLPYCDGDVSNQQGQHFIDDSRYAYDDNVLRSTVWVMGADHNFFNTVWTPGKYPYSTSDDWGATSTDSVCGPANPASARLTSNQQYDTGVAVMSAWFRLTLGHEDGFLPMFDGTIKPSLTSVPTADIRSLAQVPASGRKDIATFTEFNSKILQYGAAALSVCASTTGRTLPQALPYCAVTRGTSAVPHWTPASYAPNVPASPMTRFTWTAAGASIRVPVPAAASNASAYDALTFKTAPDEPVVTGSDMTISVVDKNGATWSSLVSALNPLAVKRMPASTSTLLNKIVLQQVSVPLSSMTGIDTTKLAEVRFASAVGADAVATGGFYLNDLALAKSAVGTPVVAGSAVTVNVDPTSVEEGTGASTNQVAVVLSKPAVVPSSAWLTVLGATTTTSKAGLVAEKVTFAPGETCKAVDVPRYGDTTTSTTASTAYKYAVSFMSGAISGDKAFANLVVREDDGVTGSAVAIPAVGVQGDVCAEYAAKSQTFDLTADDLSPLAGGVVSVTGTGYRAGESVAFAHGTTALGSAVADSTGTVIAAITVPEGTPAGAYTVTGIGAGSARKSTMDLGVQAVTATTLAITPDTFGIKEAVTLTATVTGTASGTVEFFDNEESLGTAPVSSGVASLEIPSGFLAGQHYVTATFLEDDLAISSESNIVAFNLVKGEPVTMLNLAAPSTTYGAGSTGTVSVAGGAGGSVEVSVDGVVSTLTLGPDGTAEFTLPATLAVGTYDVAATFLGSDTLEEGSPVTAAYAVTKAASATKVTASSVITAGKALTFKVAVSGVAGVAKPSGTVKVVYSGATKRTVTIVDGAGASTLTFAKKGTYTVTFTYGGNASYATSAVTKTITVKAKPKKK